MMVSSAKDIRAFLAIEPSEHVLSAIAREQEKLRKEITGQVSWTRPQGQHLTLKFFDNVSLADVENISTIVKKRTDLHSPLRLSVEKLGVFPDVRKPRVLWSNVTGEVGKLLALQDVLEADFEALGLARENRPYRAHVTLARLKVFQATGGIAKVLGRHDHFSAGEFVARELILFQSHLSPQGAVYSKLAAFPLAG
jgi:2'-5' RNA ligase